MKHAKGIKRASDMTRKIQSLNTRTPNLWAYAIWYNPTTNTVAAELSAIDPDGLPIIPRIAPWVLLAAATKYLAQRDIQALITDYWAEQAAIAAEEYAQTEGFDSSP